MSEAKRAGLFYFGERQAFINGSEYGRNQATRLCQLLVASIVQKYERGNDPEAAAIACEIRDVLFNYNWGLNGEKPAMPDREPTP